MFLWAINRRKIETLTYICKMKLEEALKTSKFANEKHKATLNIIYSAYWLKTMLSNSIKPFGITIEQFNVLRILRGAYPNQICVKDIGSRMIEKSSNVPRIIDRLVAKDLVVRNTSEKDKRETLIGINKHGIELLDQANACMDAISVNNIQISEEKATILNQIMEDMRVGD